MQYARLGIFYLGYRVLSRYETVRHIPPLYGGEKRIHIDMRDAAHTFISYH